MVDTCHVTGTLIAPDGSPLPRVSALFHRLPERAFVAGDSTALPHVVRHVTSETGGVSVHLVPGPYTVRPQGASYPAFRIDVPDEPTANLADIQDDILQPPPSRIIEAVDEAKEARDEAVTYRDGAAQAAQAAEQAKNDAQGAASVATASAQQVSDVAAPLSLTSDLIYVGPLPIEPTHINARGEVVQGINGITGMPLIGGGDPPEPPAPMPDLNQVIVRRAPGDLYIHFPQESGNYIQWRFSAFERSNLRVDVWQINGVREMDSADPGATELAMIVDSGQTEPALRRAVDGSSFRIGGNAHGHDEMLGMPTMLVDGVGVDINGSGALTCRRLEIIQASQMMDPDDFSDFAKRYTRWVFEAGELRLSNTLVIEQEIEFSIMYLTMLSVVRNRYGPQITHSIVRSPEYYPVEAAADDYPTVWTGAHHLRTWGDRYSAEVEILRGWDRPGRGSNVNSSVGRNKLYFDFTGTYTPQIGEVMESEARLRVTAIGE